MGAQLKRSPSNKNPSLSTLRLDDLRESGDIEQDANLVLGILIPPGDSKRKKGEQEKGVQVFVLKNRSGVAGDTVSLKFDGPTQRFLDNTF